MCIGLVASIGYHILVKFPDSHKKGNQDEDTSSNNTSVDWSWFREYQLYQIGFVYMATRLYVNLAQAYIPFFLQVNIMYQAYGPLFIFRTLSQFFFLITEHHFSNIFHLIGQRLQRFFLKYAYCIRIKNVFILPP